LEGGGKRKDLLPSGAGREGECCRTQQTGRALEGKATCPFSAKEKDLPRGRRKKGCKKNKEKEKTKREQGTGGGGTVSGMTECEIESSGERGRGPR